MGIALVTGGAQGLGRSTALLLAEHGFEVVVVDLREVGDLRAAGGGGSLRSLAGDVSSEEFVRHLAELIGRDYGALDVLVNNAGISCIAPAEATSSEQWRRVMDVNLFGPFLLCRYLGAQMLARGAGSIVNVASIAGLAAVSHRSAYNASKHGLVGLTRTLAAEWGGRGVRVNAVCPGWIKTEMDAVDQARGTYSDRDIEERVPLARFARAGDVAQAIHFLADSARSAFINGVTLEVDGGWLADASWHSLRLSTRA